MSFTTGTQHYGLPQYNNAQVDIPSWTDDITNAFEKLDTTLYDVAEQGNTSSVKVDNLTAQVQVNTAATTKNTQDIVGLDANYKAADATLSNRISGNTSNISTNTQEITGIKQEIGNTDISSIGDGTVTGAISTLSGLDNGIFKIINLSNTEEFSIAGSTRQNCNLPLNIEDGYYPIAINSYNAGISTVIVEGVRIREKEKIITIVLFNTATNQVTYAVGNVTASVLLCKKTLVEI